MADFATSPSYAEPVPETSEARPPTTWRGARRPVVSRRTFLEGSAGVASLVAIGVTATACDGREPAAAEPWSDGSLWDDQLGWVD